MLSTTYAGYPILQALWKQYRDAVYPRDISAEQNRECHQAFMAGALVTLRRLREISTLSEDKAVQNLAALHSEAEEFARLRVNVLNAKNRN